MVLKDLYTTIQTVALSHLLVESFDSGEGYDRNVNGDKIYPQVYLLQPFQITTNEVQPTPTESYDITFEVLDIDRSHEPNRIDILSTTKTIGLQIIEKLRADYSPNIQIGDSISITTVLDYTDDSCTGCVFNFNIVMPKEVNKACIADIFNNGN